MGPSRLLQTDTFGCFDLLVIMDWAQMKPERELLPRCFIEIVTEGRIAKPTTRIYSITGFWRYKALEIVYALVYQEDKLVPASTEHPSFGVRRRVKWRNTSLHFPLLYIDHSPRYASTDYSFIIVPHITHVMPFRINTCN